MTTPKLDGLLSLIKDAPPVSIKAKAEAFLIRSDEGLLVCETIPEGVIVREPLPARPVVYKYKHL